MKSRRLFAILVIMMGAAGVQAEPVVVSSSEPELPAREVAFDESWTVGGEDGDIIFGMMIDSAEGPDGNIYMLDAQLCQVEVFAPDGEHLRTISAGPGPGSGSGRRGSGMDRNGRCSALPGAACRARGVAAAAPG